MSDLPSHLNEQIESKLDEAIEQGKDAQSAKPTTPTQLDADGVESMEKSLNFQQSIDSSLKRLFTTAEMPKTLRDQLEDRTPTVAPQSKTHSSKTHGSARILGMPQWSVAALLLIGIGSWVVMGLGYLFPEPDHYRERMAVAIYQKVVDKGFEPDWFCEDEKLFADTFAERQGKGVWLRPLPEGIRMAGLAYHKGLGESTTSMLAWVDDKPVMLFVDKSNAIPKRLLEDRPDDDLQIFTQRLGNLTIVEVTPFEESKIASFLYLAEPPKEPTGRVPGS